MRAPNDDLPRHRQTVAGAAAVLLGLVVLGGTATAPPSAALLLLDPVVLVAAALSGSRALLWSLAALLMAADYAPLLLGSGAPWGSSALAAANRTLAIVSNLVVAVLAHRWIGAQERLARKGHDLQAHDRRREVVLSQMLHLSRALVGDLTAHDVMARVCRALVVMLVREGGAAAILLRDGETLRIVSSAGFGPDGPAVAVLPFAGSVAGVTLATGHTTTMEDLGQRRARVPQPRSGLPFRAALSTPIVVDAEAIGTLEVYAHAPTRWSDETVDLIGSMAAQTSISLHAVHLFEEVDDIRRRFEAVFSTLPIPVLVARDAGCRQVDGNPAASAVLAGGIENALSPFAVASGPARPMALRDGAPVAREDFPLARAVLQGTAVRAEELDLLVDGARRMTVLASAAPIRDGGGEVTGGVCAFVDITSQKALEREIETRRHDAEMADARKTRFLAAVSHDVRTPANAIRLQAELIRRSAGDPARIDRVPRLASDLERTATSMIELVTEMLDLAQLDTGHVELQETEFPLAHTLETVCAELRPVARAKGLALICEPIAPSLWLHVDRVKLARVVTSLVDNAVKFTSAGEVRVHAAREAAGGVRIAVTDTGPGIPSEHLPRVFDEFFQLRNPERNQRKGPGLGLAISKRLMDAIGGTIAVESRVNEGTQAIVSLPTGAVVHGAVAHARASEDGNEGTRLDGLRILLAEDHADTRDAVAALLRAEGAQVAEASDGPAALERLYTERPQLLLLDLMMPGVDGLGVLERIRRKWPPSLEHVVVVTGDQSRDDTELLRLGADAVLMKPIEPSRLLDRLCTVMASRRAGAH